MAFCQSCGTEVKSSWRNCTNCGAIIENTASPDPSLFSDLQLMQSGWTVEQISQLRNPSSSQQSFEVLPIQTSQYHDNTINSCLNCGKELFQGWRKCSHCGYEQVTESDNRFNWDSPENSSYLANSTGYFAEYRRHINQSLTPLVKIRMLIDTNFLFALCIALPIKILFFEFDDVGLERYILLSFILVYIVNRFSLFLPDDYPKFRWETVKIGGKKYHECTICRNHKEKKSFWTGLSLSAMKEHFEITHKRRWWDAPLDEISPPGFRRFRYKISGLIIWIAAFNVLLLIGKFWLF
jgi:ribosomal protein L37E